jgi:hypothetical protein
VHGVYCSICNSGIPRKWQLEITACQHQILILFGHKCYEHFQNVELSFQRANNWNNTNSGVVLKLKKQHDFCWRCQVPWTLIDKQNIWNVVRVQALLLKMEDSLYLKLLTCCQKSFRSVQTILKDYLSMCQITT